MSRKRVRTSLLVAGLAAIHGVLTVISISQGLILFRGPTTPGEKFWAGAMDVLLFPGILFIEFVRDSGWQFVLVIVNSLLWGSALTFVIVQWRKRRAHERQ